MDKGVRVRKNKGWVGGRIVGQGQPGGQGFRGWLWPSQRRVPRAPTRGVFGAAGSANIREGVGPRSVLLSQPQAPELSLTFVSMYRKPAPGYVPSPSSTPDPYGNQQQQQPPPRPASRPLPSSPHPPTQHQHQPYLGHQSPGPISDEEAFELGYPDRPRSPSPNPQGVGLQALYGAAGHGVNVTSGGGPAGGSSQYGALPQSAYDDPNPFQDPAAGMSYGMGGGYDAAPQIRIVPAQQQSYAPPAPSHSPIHHAFSPPPQSYHPSASPYQLPSHRALSPIANPGLSVFDATLAAFNNGVLPAGRRSPAGSSAVSSNYYPSATSPASFQQQTPPLPPPQHQQPHVYHPGQAVDPEQYAGYDRFTPKNLYGENQPARLRSRSPTPPLEEDLGDGGRSPSLEEHFAGTAVDRSTFKHLLPPTDFEQGEKAAFLEDLANGDLGDDDDDDEVRPTQHFGPAPEGKILRRNKTRRKVKLTSSGNLVVQAPIPSGLATLLKQFSGDTERTRTT